MRHAPQHALLLLFLLDSCHPSTVDLVISTKGQKLTSTCDLSQMVARLLVPDQSKVFILDRVENGFSGRCEGIERQTKVLFILEYLSLVGEQELLLTRAQKMVDLEGSEGDITVSFQPEDFSTQDQDLDGMTNLDEICSGRDPYVKDAPQFDKVEHEAAAIGGDRYVIGERVRLVGQSLPDGELLRLTIGPFLDPPQEQRDLVPLEVTSTAITLQIPPGLDTSSAITLKAEALGITWSNPLLVSRVWASGHPTRSGIFMMTQGTYTPTSQNSAVEHCFTSQANCSIIDSIKDCRTTVEDISQDGRHLLCLCKTDLSASVQVVDIPTNNRWIVNHNTAPTGSALLLRADTVLTVLDPTAGTLSTFPVATASRSIAAQASVIPLAEARTFCQDPQQERVFVLTQGQSAGAVRRFAVSADGSLVVEGNPVVIDGYECADDRCEGTAITAVDKDRVIISRQDKNALMLLDFTNGSTKTQEVMAPSWVTVTPRSRDQIYSTSNLKGVSTTKVGFCRLDITTFGSTDPACTYSIFGLISGTGSITVVPEETHAFVTVQKLAPFVLEIQQNSFEPLPGILDRFNHILVQP